MFAENDNEWASLDALSLRAQAGRAQNTNPNHSVDEHSVSRVGCGSKLTNRGPQILVHVSTYQGKPFWGYPIFDPQPCDDHCDS